MKKYELTPKGFKRIFSTNKHKYRYVEKADNAIYAISQKTLDFYAKNDFLDYSNFIKVQYDKSEKQIYAIIENETMLVNVDGIFAKKPINGEHEFAKQFVLYSIAKTIERLDNENAK